MRFIGAFYNRDAFGDPRSCTLGLLMHSTTLVNRHLYCRADVQNLISTALRIPIKSSARKDPGWIELSKKSFYKKATKEVWSFGNLPNRKRAIGTKWVFRNKKDKRVTKHEQALDSEVHKQGGLYKKDDWNGMQKLLRMKLKLKLIHAKVEDKTIVIPESSVRRDLQFDDEDGSGPRCQDTILGDADSETRVLNLDTTKPLLKQGIASLKKRVKKLEKKRKSKTPRMNLFKIGTSSRRSLFEEDASKQGRNLKQGKQSSIFEDINTASALVTTAGVSVSTAEPITTASVNITTAEPITPPTTTVFEDEDLTIAQTLVKMRSEKSKVRGVVMQEPSETATRPTVPPQQHDPKDKGKGKMVEQEKPLKKKDQIKFDEEIAQRLQAQNKLKKKKKNRKEERLAREREEDANIDQWDNAQAMMDVDYELAARIQAQEQEDGERSKDRLSGSALCSTRVRSEMSRIGYENVALKATFPDVSKVQYIPLWPYELLHPNLRIPHYDTIIEDLKRVANGIVMLKIVLEIPLQFGVAERLSRKHSSIEHGSFRCVFQGEDIAREGYYLRTLEGILVVESICKVKYVCVEAMKCTFIGTALIPLVIPIE
ncbi:hypothetical protein Tco_0158506 [Tanacetum coccineum]